MTNVDDHKITIEMASDYAPYWTDKQEFRSNDLVEWDDSAHYGTMTDSARRDNAYVLDFGVGQTKCEAIRFRIKVENTSGGSATEGAIINGMSLEVGVKPGLYNAGKQMEKV
jgi:hypothetical protein